MCATLQFEVRRMAGCPYAESLLDVNERNCIDHRI